MVYKHLHIGSPIFNLHVQCEKIYQICLCFASSVHPFTNLNKNSSSTCDKINFQSDLMSCLFLSI